MDGKSPFFDNFINQDFNGLSNWLNTLNPYEFAAIGTLVAFLIAPTLNSNQQNSMGNFLEQIGITLLTIQAQTITVQQANGGNPNNNLKKEIELLRREIDRLKTKVDK